jgi:hypothetical protein
MDNGITKINLKMQLVVLTASSSIVVVDRTWRGSV